MLYGSASANKIAPDTNISQEPTLANQLLLPIQYAYLLPGRQVGDIILPASQHKNHHHLPAGILWSNYSVEPTVLADKFHQLATVTTFTCLLVKYTSQQKSKTQCSFQLKNTAYWLFLSWSTQWYHIHMCITWKFNLVSTTWSTCAYQMVFISGWATHYFSQNY